jgi:hypothetical protein
MSRKELEQVQAIKTLNRKESIQMNAKKISLLVSSVVAGLALLLSGCGPAAQASEVTGAAPGEGGPGQVVESFYRGYLEYPGHFIGDGAHHSDAHLSERMVEKVDEIVASFTHGGYDPFLCAQDIPGAWVVEERMVSEQEARVVLHEIWNPGTQFESVRDVTVSLKVIDGQWQIDDIVCPAP